MSASSTSSYTNSPPFIEKLNAEVGKVIVGQKAMVERIMIGLLTGGHVLLEGVPGPGQDPHGPHAGRRSWR
jgi:MoxR-like ATPase